MEDKRIYVLAQFDRATEQRLTNIYNQLIQAGFCGKQMLFDVQINHIGLFNLEVLFPAPAMNQKLLDLHHLMSPYEPISGIHNWAAHATLLIDESEVIQKAIPIVSRVFSPITAKLESIGVYECFPARFISNFKRNI